MKIRQTQYQDLELIEQIQEGVHWQLLVESVLNLHLPLQQPWLFICYSYHVNFTLTKRQRQRDDVLQTNRLKSNWTQNVKSIYLRITAFSALSYLIMPLPYIFY